MKNETATRAVTMALLAKSDFRPKGDLVFIAQADEENGEFEVGLCWLRHERPDIRCDYSIDEGGGTRLTLADGRVIVPINVGEKATLPVRLTALGEAGHASTPTAGNNAVLLLATLIARLGRHQTKRRLPLFGATIAPTLLQGSNARNVMPGRAGVVCDCRVLPGMGAADLEAEFRAALGSDISYELEFIEGPTGGSITSIDTPLFPLFEEFLAREDPEATLIPTICTGFTDSHYLREAFGTAAYGFWPTKHTPVDVYFEGIHNKDERIHLDDLVYATRFHLFVAQRFQSLSSPQTT